MNSPPPRPASYLTVADHNRDVTGMLYVYPVVSRRAGGVSVGINLNVNNACNWRCIYCQVPNLKRGGPPPVDLDRLEAELHTLLDWLYSGDFMAQFVSPESRRIVDIAFSGNGEPTSAKAFATAVERVVRLRDTFAGRAVNAVHPVVRLITNGSLIERAHVRPGLARLGQAGGEVWFKVDAIGRASTLRINSVSANPEAVLHRLQTCASLCTTWLQTCLFALDGQAPAERHLNDYLRWLEQARTHLAGVLLYGVARPSHQVEAPRLSALSPERMQEIAATITARSGLTVKVSP